MQLQSTCRGDIDTVCLIVIKSTADQVGQGNLPRRKAVVTVITGAIVDKLQIATVKMHTAVIVVKHAMMDCCFVYVHQMDAVTGKSGTFDIFNMKIIGGFFFFIVFSKNTMHTFAYLFSAQRQSADHGSFGIGQINQADCIRITCQQYRASLCITCVRGKPAQGHMCRNVQFSHGISSGGNNDMFSCFFRCQQGVLKCLCVIVHTVSQSAVRQNGNAGCKVCIHGFCSFYFSQFIISNL